MKEASRKLNKYNFKILFYIYLWQPHSERNKSYYYDQFTRCQYTSLEINTSNPKFNVQRDKSNQTSDIITKHYNSIEEENQKPKET